MKPTAEDAERAKRIARERGWLTDEGWIWERFCKCEGKRNSYRGRDGMWHCEWCDGLMPEDEER